MHTSRRAAALALLALAACSRAAPLPPVDGTPGATPVLAFGYSGDLAGSWRAEGTLHVPTANRTTWAAGRRSGGKVDVQAAYQRPDGRSDWVALVIPRTTPGTAMLDATCTGTLCAEAFVAFGLRNEHGAQAEHSCTLATGTLRLTHVSAERARGEFSGSGECLGADGSLLERFEVAGGSFDVPLM